MGFTGDVLLSETYKIGDTSNTASMRTGTVVAIDTVMGTIDVDVAGSTLKQVPYASGMVPAMGKTVWLIEQGTWFAAISSAASTEQGVTYDQLSHSVYRVSGQSVPQQVAWTQVAPATETPSGDHPFAFGSGTWTAPTDGVWQLEIHTVVDGDYSVEVAMTQGTQSFPQASPSTGSGTSGSGTVWTGDLAGGEVFEFWLAHGANNGAKLMSTIITATRMRRTFPNYTGFAGEGDYVLKSGDTMLGPLVLDGDPLYPLSAAPKQYVDGKVVNAWGTGSTQEAPSAAAVESALASIEDNQVVAGAGLTGGGPVSDDPTLNVVAGTGITVGMDSVALDTAYTDGRYPPVARNMVAGAGLTGGGTLAADRTFAVGAGTGITVAADAVALDKAYTDGLYPPQTRNVIAGAGLTGGGTLAEDRTLNVGAGTGVTVAADSVALDKAYTDGLYPAKTNQVVAGNGLTGGGDLSASRTLNVGAGAGIAVSADAVALDTAYTDARYPKSTVSSTAPTSPKVGDIWTKP